MVLGQGLEVGLGRLLHQIPLVLNLPRPLDKQRPPRDSGLRLLASQRLDRPGLEVRVHRAEDLVKLRVEAGLVLARLLARLENRHLARQDLGSQHLDKLRSHLPPSGNRHNLRRHLASLRSRHPPLGNLRNRHPGLANLRSHPLALVSLLNLPLDLGNPRLGHQASDKMRLRIRSPQHLQLAASANHLNPPPHLDSLHNLLQHSASRANPHLPLDKPASLLPLSDSQVNLPLRLGRRASQASLHPSANLQPLGSQLVPDRRHSGPRRLPSQRQQIRSAGRSEKLNPKRRTWTPQHRRPHAPSLEPTPSEIPRVEQQISLSINHLQPLQHQLQ